jgi:hypothetical protein
MKLALAVATLALAVLGSVPAMAAPAAPVAPAVVDAKAAVEQVGYRYRPRVYGYYYVAPRVVIVPRSYYRYRYHH